MINITFNISYRQSGKTSFAILKAIEAASANYTSSAVLYVCPNWASIRAIETRWGKGIPSHIRFMTPKELLSPAKDLSEFHTIIFDEYFCYSHQELIAIKAKLSSRDYIASEVDKEIHIYSSPYLVWSLEEFNKIQADPLSPWLFSMNCPNHLFKVTIINTVKPVTEKTNYSLLNEDGYFLGKLQHIPVKWPFQ